MGSYVLAEYLEQFDLTIEELVEESGRPRSTLYTWFKDDKKLLGCIIRSRLSQNYEAMNSDYKAKLSKVA